MEKKSNITNIFAREKRILCAMEPSVLADLAKTLDLPSVSDINQVAKKLLIALDEKLHTDLQRIALPQANPKRIPTYRPSLLSFKSWLLKQIIEQYQVKDEAKRRGKSFERGAYILPEDLPKIIDDLWLFHKLVERSRASARKEEDPILKVHERDINDYNLESLSKAVAPHRPKYPLTTERRIAAHKKFLVEQGGNGEARLLGTLSNGTEVIELLSQHAAITYGSPRWCTAWLPPRKNYFEDCKDNLWVVVAADGSRWQVHMASLQWKDADDQDIESTYFLKEQQPGLGKIIAKQIPSMLEEAFWAKDIDTFGQIFSPAANDKECRHEINNLFPNFGNKLAAQLSLLAETPHSEDETYDLITTLDEAAVLTAWRKEIPETFLQKMLFEAAKANDFNPINQICTTALGYSDWHKLFAQRHWIDEAFRISIASEKAYNAFQILESGSNSSEWQKIIPVDLIAPALYMAAEAIDLRAYGQMLGECAKVPAWREAVPIDSIATALARKNGPKHQGKEAYPGISEEWCTEVGIRFVNEAIVTVPEWSDAAATKPITRRPRKGIDPRT